MARIQPGEVWLVNLGLAAKVRPCLVMSDHPADDELALVIVVHTQPPCGTTGGKLQLQSGF